MPVIFRVPYCNDIQISLLSNHLLINWNKKLHILADTKEMPIRVRLKILY